MILCGRRGTAVNTTELSHLASPVFVVGRVGSGEVLDIMW